MKKNKWKNWGVCVREGGGTLVLSKIWYLLDNALLWFLIVQEIVPRGQRVQDCMTSEDDAKVLIPGN